MLVLFRQQGLKMRYREFRRSIFEIDLGLSDRQMRRIRPLVGFEFEMYVDNISIDDTDNYEPDYEADYSDNPAPRNINDIIEFFDDSDYNSRQEIRNLETRLRNEFQEWASESFDSRWESDKKSFVYDYIANNWDEGDVADLLELDPDSIDGLTRAQVESAADRIIEAGGYQLNNIRKQALDEYMDDSDIEAEWLDEIGLNSMGDVQTDYNIAWPYYSDIGPGYVDNSSISWQHAIKFEELALEFMRALGYKSIAISTTYHGSYQRYDQGKNDWYDIGNTKPDDCYTIEPDGSLNKPDYAGAMGLEFVSPPITIEQMRRDIDNIKRWAKERAHTNNTTGLHMNVSVPDYDINQLDPVKLALLIADEYVLDQYNRLNTKWGQLYTKSVAQKIKTNLNNWSKEEINTAINTATDGLDKLRKKIISTGDIKGHYSINPEDNRVEFRGPGGNWLQAPTEELIKTAKRFAIGLASAINPALNRDDYIKKLNQIAQPEQPNQRDPLSLFVLYNNKQITKDALVKKIALLRTDREIERDAVIAAEPDDDNDKTSRLYQVINRNYPSQVIGTFVALGTTGSKAANRAFKDFLQKINRQSGLSAPVKDYTYKEAAYSNKQLTAPETQPDANFAFVDRINNQVVQWLTRNTRAEAESALQDTGMAHLYNVVEVQPRLSSFNYTVRNVDRGTQDASIVATSRELAIRQFRQFIGRSTNNYELLDIDGQVVTTSAQLNRPMQPSGVSDSEATHEIVDRRTLNRMFVFSARSETEAADKFEAWLQANGYPVDNGYYGWRRISEPIPGSTLDLQQQRDASQNQGEFTGQWRILIDGEEVHRFGGVGNIQDDANRVGQRWVLDQIRRGLLSAAEGADVEIVPIMDRQRPSL